MEADGTQTIVIFCKNYFADHWKEVALRLKHILGNLDYEVRLEIWQAQVSHGTFDPPPITINPKQLEEVVYMSDGIGPMDKSGTPGALVLRIRHKLQVRSCSVPDTFPIFKL